MTDNQMDLLRHGSWLNEPPSWSLEADGLRMETGKETDFWRDTLYGFRHDNGHGLLVPTEGDFTVFVTFEGTYEALYDQAGLILRQDEEVWLKAGIEHSDGVANMSVVATNSVSDWSTTALPPLTRPQRLRLTRLSDAIVVQFRNDANRWQLLRVASLRAKGPLSVGPMACSPLRSGFRATFTEFRLTAPVEGALHDETPAD
jgi:uncharacterized protein